MNSFLQETTVEVIKNLGVQLRNTVGFSKVMWIPNARIPIVKLKYNGYDADISLYNLLVSWCCQVKLLFKAFIYCQIVMIFCLV